MIKWMALVGAAALLATGCSSPRGGAYDSGDTYDVHNRYNAWGYPGGQSDLTMPNDTGARQEGMGGSTSTPGPGLPSYNEPINPPPTPPSTSR